jgi:hypothetical protein
MNEEYFFLKATEEFDDGSKDLGMWAKSVALADGDLTKAKYSYIRERAKQLHSDALLELKKLTSEINSFGDAYVPIELFAKNKNSNREVVIDLVNKGIYTGRNIGGEWYVLLPEAKLKSINNKRTAAYSGAVLALVALLFFADATYKLRNAELAVENYIKWNEGSGKLMLEMERMDEHRYRSQAFERISCLSNENDTHYYYANNCKEKLAPRKSITNKPKPWVYPSAWYYSIPYQLFAGDIMNKGHEFHMKAVNYWLDNPNG